MTMLREEFPIGYLDIAAKEFGRSIAVEMAGTTYTYSALKVAVDALATALQMHFGTRAPIAICAFNSLEYIVSILAIQASGNIQIVLNPRNSPRQLQDVLETVDPVALIVTEDCLSLLPENDKQKILARLVPGGQTGGLKETGQLIADYQGQKPEWPALTLDDVNAIKFTGGSTGKPKGVLQTYRNVLCMIESYQDYYGFGADECHLAVAPLTHAAGTFMLAVFKAGGKFLISPATDTNSILDALEHAGVTSSLLPPTLFYNLMQVPYVAERTYPRLRQLIYGVAPMTPEKIRKAQSTFGPVIGVSYGQTEAPMVIAAGSAAELALPENMASVGRINPRVEVGVMDREGHELPRGSMGEVVVKGDLVMKGYLDPGQTRETIKNGWLHTGDVGIIDERGYLFLKDRIKDMIITGGFNVYPGEVERAICGHPDVHECIVFGRSDEKWGERVEAAVVLKAGAATTAEELVVFSKREVSSVQAPKVIHIMESLPRNAVGKVTRISVRAETARSL